MQLELLSASHHEAIIYRQHISVFSWQIRAKKLIILALNGTNPGLFQIRFQYIWLDRAKHTIPLSDIPV